MSACGNERTEGMRRKAMSLPVEERDYGFVQRMSYSNLDLLHEEVLELDSPFAALPGSADTAVVTFLLVGDQNAGKSSLSPSHLHPPFPCAHRVPSPSSSPPPSS